MCEIGELCDLDIGQTASTLGTPCDVPALHAPRMKAAAAKASGFTSYSVSGGAPDGF
jgi:hypothetical protein